MSDVEIKRQVFTFQDALLFKQRFINTWRPGSEVWALKYGDALLGSFSTFGSMFITYKFRKALNLRAYARLTCYTPVVGISSLVNCMIQEYFITSSVIRQNRCPLCISTQASLFQVIFGVLYPVTAASLVCFYMADKLYTYPVPPLVQAPREVYLLFKKIILKNSRPFLVIGAMHMFAASFITLKKQKNFDNLDVEGKYKKFMK